MPITFTFRNRILIYKCRYRPYKSFVTKENDLMLESQQKSENKHLDCTVDSHSYPHSLLYTSGSSLSTGTIPVPASAAGQPFSGGQRDRACAGYYLQRRLFSYRQNF